MVASHLPVDSIQQVIPAAGGLLPNPQPGAQVRVDALQGVKERLPEICLVEVDTFQSARTDAAGDADISAIAEPNGDSGRLHRPELIRPPLSKRFSFACNNRNRCQTCRDGFQGGSLNRVCAHCITSRLKARQNSATGTKNCRRASPCSWLLTGQRRFSCQSWPPHQRETNFVGSPCGSVALYNLFGSKMRTGTPSAYSSSQATV